MSKGPGRNLENATVLCAGQLPLIHLALALVRDV